MSLSSCGHTERTRVYSKSDYALHSMGRELISRQVVNSIAKTTFQVIGNWLVYVASRIARFNDWELNRAERGVKKVADGE